MALAGAAGAGRLLIAFLAPDRVDRGEGPATWAAALYLGWAALALEADLASRAGVAHRTPLLLAPWVALAALRWLTLPGAIAPRHAPRPPRRHGTELLVWLGVGAALLTHALDRPGYADQAPGVLPGVARPTSSWLPLPEEVRPALHLTACAIFLYSGLRTARRAPLAAAGVVLALTLTPALRGLGAGSLAGAALLCAGAASATAWLRRANRRALQLALGAFALLPMTGAPDAHAAGMASLAVLCLATPGPSRKRVAKGAALGLGYHALHYFFAGCPASAPAEALPVPVVTWAWWIAAVGAAFATRSRCRRHERVDREPNARGAPAIDPPDRESTFLVLQIGACVVAVALSAELSPAHGGLLLPLAALLTGFALPAERAWTEADR